MPFSTGRYQALSRVTARTIGSSKTVRCLVPPDGLRSELLDLIAALAALGGLLSGTTFLSLGLAVLIGRRGWGDEFEGSAELTTERLTPILCISLGVTGLCLAVMTVTLVWRRCGSDPVNAR